MSDLMDILLAAQVQIDAHTAERVAHEIAKRRVLADVDSFAHWLAAHCDDQHHVDSGHIVREPRQSAARMPGADTPELLHLLLTAQDDRIALAARRELISRYLCGRRSLLRAEIVSLTGTAQALPLPADRRETGADTLINPEDA